MRARGNPQNPKTPTIGPNPKGLPIKPMIARLVVQVPCWGHNGVRYMASISRPLREGPARSWTCASLHRLEHLFLVDLLHEAILEIRDGPSCRLPEIRGPFLDSRLFLRALGPSEWALNLPERNLQNGS